MTRLSLMLLIFTLVACGNKDGGRSADQAAQKLQSGDRGSIGNGQFDKGLPEKALTQGVGFTSVDAPGVPQSVKNAADSVFEVRVLGASTDESLIILDFSNGEDPNWKAQIEATKDPFERTVLLKQVEACHSGQNFKSSKKCAVSLEMAKATAFLAGPEGLLWTNFHVIKRALEFRSQLTEMTVADQLVRKERVVIYVFDRRGQLVLDPNKTPVHLAVIPQTATSENADESQMKTDSDYIGLKLGSSIGNALPFAGRALKENEPVYLLGYPACTGCSSEDFLGDIDELDFTDRSPGQNSNGMGLKVSAGVGISPQTSMNIFGYGEEVSRHWNLERMFFSSNDSQHGNSGGPLLNSQGQVLSIHAAGKGFSRDGKLERVSTSVAPDEFLTRGQ